MKPRVLFIVQDDPRISPRPAEAVRIAAGVGTWKKSDVSIYLRDAAVLCLGEPAGQLIDEEDFARYWPILAECNAAIYAQKNAAAFRQLGEAAVAFKEITTEELAELAAAQTYVLRF
jgi:hypothetical protein